MDFPCADNSCIVFTVLLLIMAASCVHALFMLHSLQPVHGGVNFILAQLYLGVYTPLLFIIVASGSIILTQKSAMRRYCPRLTSRSGSPSRSIQSCRYLFPCVNSSWRASSIAVGGWRGDESSSNSSSSSGGMQATHADGGSIRSSATSWSKPFPCWRDSSCAFSCTSWGKRAARWARAAKQGFIEERAALACTLVASA